MEKKLTIFEFCIIRLVIERKCVKENPYVIIELVACGFKIDNKVGHGIRGLTCSVKAKNQGSVLVVWWDSRLIIF